MSGCRRPAEAAQSALLAALFCLLAAPVAAQELRARVLSAETNTPLAGAFLTLEPDGPGAQVSRLTDGAGWARLPAPAGRYTLRVERLGYATYRSEPFRLEASVVRTFAVAEQPIVLPAIRASGRSRCGVPGPDAAAAVALWDEVRKALVLVRWTDTEASFEYVVREYRRRLDPASLRVLEERSEHATMRLAGSPFRSLGAEDLATRGFIRTAADGGYEYYGPDAEVILSPWFGERHCFQAVRSAAAPGLLGLSFVPSGDAPEWDIEGVLWVDSATAELRHLEYRYSRLPVPAPRERVGGRTEFQRLPSGHWIVRAWSIRAPLLQLSRGRDRVRVIAYDEVGREVLSALEAARR